MRVGDLIRLKKPFRNQILLEMKFMKITDGVYLYIGERFRFAGDKYPGELFNKDPPVLYFKFINPDGMLVEIPASAQWCWELVLPEEEKEND